jgi:phenylpropionate dioxygenase-like ring-hydroxylating dioxygenase large terminal subunit
MYINFWYPMATSEEITSYEPFRTMVLGLKFVAFRDNEGEAHVLSDTCIHRGGTLGKGWVQDGCAVCPYHGWQFDGSGKCVEIPTVAKKNIPARAKVDSYPVQEKYGIVFAFLGDLPEEERPPLIDIVEWDQEGWRANQLFVFEVNGFYERSIENGLDPSHNQFVHPAQGSPEMNPDLKRKPLEMEDLPWGSKFIVEFENKSTGTEALQEQATTKVSEVYAGSGHIGPNQMITWIKFSEENKFHQYFIEQPIDENHVRIFFHNMRTFLLDPEYDGRLRKVNLVVAKEDIAIIEELDPVRTPQSPNKEVLVPSDAAIVRYREYLKEWENKGWRIDMETLRAKRGDVAYAIPCPARRTEKNWALDTVPLLPAAAPQLKEAKRA